jgi:hypothetical protein
MGILKILMNLTKNSKRWLKLKYGYHKLKLFKVWVPYFKSDKRSGVISKVFLFFFNSMNKVGINFIKK